MQCDALGRLGHRKKDQYSRLRSDASVGADGRCFDGASHRFEDAREAGRSWLPILALCIASFVLAMVVAWGVSEAMPHLEDEHANLFQAKVFARGRITNPAPPVPKAFFVPFVVTRDGQQFGKYTPGYPLLLAAGVLLGQPWVVNALAAALGILATYLLGRDLFDRQTGLLAAALGVASPMYAMLAGSLLSHSTTLAALTLFAWAFLRARQSTEPHRYAFAWATGGLAGLALAIRPWTAFGIGLPFAALATVDLVRKRERWPGIYGRMAAAFVLVGAIWPLYNWVTTGSALANTYSFIWDYDRPGFGPGVGSRGYGWPEIVLNLRLGLEGLASQMAQPLLLLLIVLGVTLSERRAIEPLLLVPVCTLVAVYTAYWSNSVGLYGPRYYAEAMPFLWLVAARGLLKVGRWRPGWTLAAVALLACLAWNVYSSLPRFQQLRGMYNISREDMNRISAADVRGGLVFVHSDYWTEYANLSWLNGADLQESDYVFAKDWGAETNRAVAKSFPGRDIYCYDRNRTVPLEPCPPGSLTLTCGA